MDESDGEIEISYRSACVRESLETKMMGKNVEIYSKNGMVAIVSLPRSAVIFHIMCMISRDYLKLEMSLLYRITSCCI